MDRGDFDDLVQRIERRYHGRPRALAGNAGLWLLIGYALVMLMTLVLVGGGLAVFAYGVTLPSEAAVWLILLGAALITFGVVQIAVLLIVELPEPDGRRLGRDEAPALQSLMRRLEAELECEPVHAIFLSGELNAAVAHSPRLGFFGWSRSWLVIGLPLLLATSLEETQAILAHECAHLSRKHGRYGKHIYHVRRTWERLVAGLQNKSSSAIVRALQYSVRKFLMWYWPRFHARAFVLSRQHEFEADRIASQVTTPDAAASALWRMECIGNMSVAHFWKNVWAQSAELPEPPDDIYERFNMALKDAAVSTAASRWREDAMARTASNSDTHPSLAQRLQSLGTSSEVLRTLSFPNQPSMSAAEVLLSDDLATLQQEMNDRWRARVSPIWRDRYRRARLLHKFVDGNNQSPSQQTVSPADLWSHIGQVANAKGLEAAEPLARQMLAIQPDHPGATYLLARQRLIDRPDEGEALLRHVLDLQNREWSAAAGSALEQHYVQSGQRDKLRNVRNQLDELEKSRTAAEKERADIRPGNALLPHGLSDIELAPLITTLIALPNCHSVWLVQKQLQHFPSDRMFVVCVDSAIGNRQDRREKNEQLSASLLLNAQLPGRVFVANPTGEFRRLAARMMKNESWKIFDRNRVPQSQGGTTAVR